MPLASFPAIEGGGGKFKIESCAFYSSLFSSWGNRPKYLNTGQRKYAGHLDITE
jgi:hypothetical protein